VKVFFTCKQRTPGCRFPTVHSLYTDVLCQSMVQIWTRKHSWRINSCQRAAVFDAEPNAVKHVSHEPCIRMCAKLSAINDVLVSLLYRLYCSQHALFGGPRIRYTYDAGRTCCNIIFASPVPAEHSNKVHPSSTPQHTRLLECTFSRREDAMT
jgi:hypothetical protein